MFQYVTHRGSKAHWLVIRPPFPPARPTPIDAGKRCRLVEQHLRYRLGHMYLVFGMDNDPHYSATGRMGLHFGLHEGSYEMRLFTTVIMEDLRCKPLGATLEEVISHCVDDSPLTTTELERNQFKAVLEVSA